MALKSLLETPERISFKVAPFALFKTINALKYEAMSNPGYHYEYGVSIEDNELIVWCTKEQRLEANLNTIDQVKKGYINPDYIPFYNKIKKE